MFGMPGRGDQGANLAGLTLFRFCRIEDVARVYVNAQLSMFIRYQQSRRAHRAKRLTHYQRAARSPI